MVGPRMHLGRPGSRSAAVKRGKVRSVAFAQNHEGPTQADPRRSQSPSRSVLKGRSGASVAPSSADYRPGRDGETNLIACVNQLVLGETQRPLNEQSPTVQDAFESAVLPLYDFNEEDAARICDSSICLMMEGLKTDIQALAATFPHVARPRHDDDDHDDAYDMLEELLVPENAELIRYIGCLAQGGPNHIDGWREVLSGDCDNSSRNALVYGIIGRALKEYVFGELYFGAAPSLAEKLARMEKEQVDQDGFYRTEQRANEILRTQQKVCTVSTNKKIAKLALQLEQLLLPLFSLGGDEHHSSYRNQGKQLAQIISKAVTLSRWMRAIPDAVYHLTSVFKDEEFDPTRMDAYNLEEMIKLSPYDKKKLHGMDRAVLRPGEEARSEAVVSVICLPGVVVYRRGGGSHARKEDDREERENRHLPADVRAHRQRIAAVDNRPTIQGGFRTRTICKSVVYLEWSKQRLLTKEAGTSVHIDAMQGRNGKTMKRYTDNNAKYAEFQAMFEGVMAGKSVGEQERAAGNASPKSWFGGLGRRM